MAAFGGSVARRYARALFAIGVDKGKFEAFGREIDALAALWTGSADLREALSNPVFRLDQRRAILDKLLPQVAPSPEVKSFALLLLGRLRIPALPAIARAYKTLVDEKLGRVQALVTSAKPLDPATAVSVQRALERRTGKKVVMESTVDPSLIGGIVARVGDLVFDGSLRTRLETLRSRILN
jgi:F-type H+-transporting ATPase subunit delta